MPPWTASAWCAIASIVPDLWHTWQRRPGIPSRRVSPICDLRREEERSGEPTPTFNHPVRKLEIPIHPGNTGRLKEIARKREPSLQERIEYMVEINRQLARDHTEDYARMFDALLEQEEGAFLVHCSAGKDRTGFACALILHALGVPEETVLEDYLFTNEALDMDGYMIPLLLKHRAEVPEDRDTLLAILGVRREYLQGALDTIEEEFEGVEEYLRNVIGLDDAAKAVLRRRYLE